MVTGSRPHDTYGRRIDQPLAMIGIDPEQLTAPRYRKKVPITAKVHRRGIEHDARKRGLVGLGYRPERCDDRHDQQPTKMPTHAPYPCNPWSQYSIRATGRTVAPG